MKAAIVYFLKHHQNTFKLVKAISDKYGADLIDVSAEPKCDLRDYDVSALRPGSITQNFTNRSSAAQKTACRKTKRCFWSILTRHSEKDIRTQS